jgi:hypothetical protein
MVKCFYNTYINFFILNESRSIESPFIKFKISLLSFLNSIESESLLNIEKLSIELFFK